MLTLLAQTAITPETTVPLGWIVAGLGALVTAAGTGAIGLYKANKADAETAKLWIEVSNLKTEQAAMKSEHGHIAKAMDDLRSSVKEELRDLKQNLELRQSSIHDRLNEITALLIDRGRKPRGD